jgi:dihydropyrimidinase
MAHYDRILTGGQVLLGDDGPIAADIAIKDGKIAGLLSTGTKMDAAERIDVCGLVILPGVIDGHLHLGHGKDIARPRVPADAAQETAAAAVGGVTTFIPYLMSAEPYETLFDEVRDVTQAGARIDFSYHFIIATEAQLAGVPRYVTEHGAPTFKIFMTNRGGEGLRLGMPDIDDGFLLRLCEAAAKSGGMVCPHPENIEASWVLRDRLKATDPEGRGGLAVWNASRPPFIEADAVQRVALLARAVNCPVYIVHCTSAEALDAAMRARAAGGTVHVETCPHYLTHDIGWPGFGPYGGDLGKINPPVRTAANREALWRGIADGRIDTVATDHVHRDASGKAGGIWAASPGCPGLETLLPVMLTEGHHKRGIPLARIAQLLSGNPARLMGLSKAKGRIAIGMDADLAAIDLNAVWTLDKTHLQSSAGYSIYEGRTFKGRVVHTLVRGRSVVRDGALVDAAVGTGRYVKRRLAG